MALEPKLISAAIDVWSAGVTLLSILTHKFPVFNSTDDVEALMEIAAVFGRAAMERCALLHSESRSQIYLGESLTCQRSDHHLQRPFRG